MGNLNKDTILSSAYNLMYAVIDNRTNIADPKHSNRTYVFDSDPFHKGFNFGDMPYIVLKLPKYAPEMQSTDGKHKEIEITFEVIIRSVQEGSSGGKNTDTGRLDMLNIMDDMTKTINSKTIRQSLSDSGLRNTELDIEAQEPVDIDQQTVYEAKGTIRTYQRIEVSD